MAVKKTVGVYDRPPERKWPRLVAVSLAIVVALALAAWWAFRSRNDDQPRSARAAAKVSMSAVRTEPHCADRRRVNFWLSSSSMPA